MLLKNKFGLSTKHTGPRAIAKSMKSDASLLKHPCQATRVHTKTMNTEKCMVMCGCLPERVRSIFFTVLFTDEFQGCFVEYFILYKQ